MLPGLKSRKPVEAGDAFVSTVSTEAATREGGAEVITELPPGVKAWFTVIVPTRNEAGNIQPLLERLKKSLAATPAEVLFVDDSTDGTDEVVRAVGRTSGLAVRLLHRSSEQRTGGLSGAVIAGFHEAHGTWAVVMDGDLQHPPELAPKLVAVGQSRGLDLVAASRKAESGRADGLADGYRRAASGFATAAAKLLFPSRLSRLSDPMSGFFAVRLAALDLDRLKPLGFKILLEIAVRQPRLLVAEVPFVFGVRLEGESKASAAEGARFVRHLARFASMSLSGRSPGPPRRAGACGFVDSSRSAWSGPPAWWSTRRRCGSSPATCSTPITCWPLYWPPRCPPPGTSSSPNCWSSPAPSRARRSAVASSSS